MSQYFLLKRLKTFALYIFVMLVIPLGCSYQNIVYEQPRILDRTGRYYVPRPIPMDPENFKSDCRLVKNINIVNEDDSSKTKTSRIGQYTHKWDVDLQNWSETASNLVRSEFKKRGVAVTDKASTVLKLSVTRAELVWKFWKIRSMLTLRVTTGSGYAAGYDVVNESIDLYDSVDGAVTKAVTAMFLDKNILNYLMPTIDTDGDGVYDCSDKCPETLEGLAVNSRGCPLDSDGDGVFDYQDQCPGTPMGVKVDSKGCPLVLDSDGDGVFDDRDECPGTPKGAQVNEKGCWIIPDVLFHYDKYDIRPQYSINIDKVIAVLQTNPSLKITLEGHTDYLGSEAYNDRLSIRRANVVMQYMIHKGIASNRLSAVGFGFSRPKTPDRSDAGRELNRRTEFKLVP